jgi:catechol 2,3-dioxygenase-like lactoylglutathione lyase family enzyme
VTGADPATGAAGLHPGQLFHVGVVAADIDAAMTQMSRDLGLTWKGGRPSRQELTLYGEPRSLEMRIAHSVQGPPHVELIQAVPGTPWEAPAAVGTHHLCYWSDTSAEAGAALEAAGARRVLGKPGAESGYFQFPNGLLVEVIGRELRDKLTAWIKGEGPRR